MFKFEILNADLKHEQHIYTHKFPKYTSQLINFANQNAQGTRPRVVGQMSELFPTFLQLATDISRDSWADWYLANNPDAIMNATDKIENQMNNLKAAIQLIDRQMIEDWVKDLIFDKTFKGLSLQEIILCALARRTQREYRRSVPEEESQGIDGYVGGVAYSVKPVTYRTMNRLSESITVKMIYYSEYTDRIEVEVDE